MNSRHFDRIQRRQPTRRTHDAERGLALAIAAVDADDQDAAAHFATFCEELRLRDDC